MSHIKLFFLALGLILLMDMIWLGLIAKPLYFKNYSSWLNLEHGKLQVVWWAAALVYISLALALVLFVIPLTNGSLSMALFYGLLMGAIIYGVYDFTCLSLFKDWPVTMAFVDCCWGATLCGLSALGTQYFSRFIL
ncbi:MAG: DUF2177 family protein [bacterium]|nr:DUF2177 family protein [bacterium]